MDDEAILTMMRTISHKMICDHLNSINGLSMYNRPVFILTGKYSNFYAINCSEMSRIKNILFDNRNRTDGKYSMTMITKDVAYTSYPKYDDKSIIMFLNKLGTVIEDLRCD
jgi:hypothetical protein